MIKDSIIEKISSDNDKVEFTEEEMLYMLKDWLQNHFKVEPKKVYTYSYFEHHPARMPMSKSHYSFKIEK